MKINKKLVGQNFTKGRNGNSIKYIVIHDTGNENPTATAMAHFNYFDSRYVGASAHYFVDEKEILQIIEDLNTSWHCGDGKGKYGITNQNSIGIEICINDGNYAMEINRTVELTKYLMNKYNIPIENVVRHYDASRKLCPAKLSSNNWKAWFEFKELLKEVVVVEDKKEQTISKWAKEGYDFVTRYNISDGTRPKDPLTREEQWTMMERYDKLRRGE